MEQPSRSNFATHDQSAYPELWTGCVFAAAPCLGPTGNKLHDYSGYNNFGTLNNAEADADWFLSTDVSRTGISSRAFALSLDGSSERVSIPHSPVFNGSSVTVSCWYMRTSSTTITNGRGIVGHYSDQRSWLLHIPPTDDTHLYFITTPDGNYSDTLTAKYETTMANNTWYHAVGVLQAGGNARLYVNGSLVATAPSTTSSLYVHTGPVEIGAMFNGYADTFFQGYIDDVRIYDHAISTDKISLLASERGIAYRPANRTSRYFLPAVGPITGTSANTLDTITSSASGTETISGSFSQTLQAFTSTTSGGMTITGTSTATTANHTSTATGSQVFTGTVAVTLEAFTSTASGSQATSATGTAAVTLDAFTSTATGAEVFTGTATPTLADFTSTASGVTATGISGTATPVLSDVTSTATGAEIFTGSSTATLANLTSTASGLAISGGAAAVTLSDATSTATGATIVNGTTSVTLASHTSTASGITGLGMQFALYLTADTKTMTLTGNHLTEILTA